MNYLNLSICDDDIIKAMETLTRIRNARNVNRCESCKVVWTPETVARVWLSHIADIVNRPNAPSSQLFMRYNPSFDWDDLLAEQAQTAPIEQ